MGSKGLAVTFFLVLVIGAAVAQGRTASEQHYIDAANRLCREQLPGIKRAAAPPTYAAAIAAFHRQNHLARDLIALKGPEPLVSRARASYRNVLTGDAWGIKSLRARQAGNKRLAARYHRRAAHFLGMANHEAIALGETDCAAK